MKLLLKQLWQPFKRFFLWLARGLLPSFIPIGMRQPAWLYPDKPDHEEILKQRLEEANWTLERSPDIAGFYVSRARIKFDLKDITGAIEDITQAIELTPSTQPEFIADYLTRRASFKATLSYFDSALADLDTTYRLNPDSIQVHINRGYIYVYQGKYEAAIDSLNIALNKLSNLDNDQIRIPLYRTRAACYHHLHAYLDALDDYSRILQLNPKDKEALGYKAYLYLRLNQPDNALKIVLKLLEIEPQDFMAADLKAFIYLVKGDLVLTELECEKLLSQYPERAEVYDTRGYLKLALKSYEAALEDFRLVNHYARESKTPQQQSLIGQALAMYLLQRKEDAHSIWLELREQDAVFGSWDDLQHKFLFPDFCQKHIQQLIIETAS